MTLYYTIFLRYTHLTIHYLHYLHYTLQPDYGTFYNPPTPSRSFGTPKYVVRAAG